MNQDDARRLLDRVAILRHASDLDLVLFFARHPHTLLAPEWSQMLSSIVNAKYCSANLPFFVGQDGCMASNIIFKQVFHSVSPDGF
jgi:hypothetical protein